MAGVFKRETITKQRKNKKTEERSQIVVFILQINLAHKHQMVELNKRNNWFFKKTLIIFFAETFQRQC